MGADRTLVTSLVLDTNNGGIPATICACGVLLFIADGGHMAWRHIDNCPIAQEALSKAGE